ncbi:OsmC family peroxiredoxin [Actinotalea sp. M2MS4P-6]|uniref:OsmC family peroxiredoxin n=1 Tax=Actinotalea sp. M2MS4P-6 TaxID=2983762 RepID=UPI0021E4C7E0|nr:OsmC family peroxiredoxin [Actinotalea sp. M2MS4P-6]MCV2393009.1 OsmC family peroxiredoxin [Actinotalea sp. M2MS4P-6]
MDFTVAVAAGSYRAGGDGALATLPHRWTRAGVEVHGELTGAHVLHLSVAVCVLNDVYREAEVLGVTVHGVRVRASGGFGDDWASTGIVYAVDVASPDDDSRVAALVARVDEVAEIPRALRHATVVTRG